jgi:Arc/MetJ-type ribon-helix-helix transcriptional regulator
MSDLKGYKDAREQKQKMIYVRVDNSMLSKLKEIRAKMGISTSELIREAIRRLFDDLDKGGNVIQV